MDTGQFFSGTKGCLISGFHCKLYSKPEFHYCSYGACCHRDGVTISISALVPSETDVPELVSGRVGHHGPVLLRLGGRHRAPVGRGAAGRGRIQWTTIHSSFGLINHSSFGLRFAAIRNSSTMGSFRHVSESKRNLHLFF